MPCHQRSWMPTRSGSLRSCERSAERGSFANGGAEQMAIDDVLRADLTDHQRAAAVDDSAEILCLACAGSGKSRTLAYRIARLIAEGARPESIVAFTFTDKAA